MIACECVREFVCVCVLLVRHVARLGLGGYLSVMFFPPPLDPTTVHAAAIVCIGKGLAQLHNAGMVHGDPTTSNMILNAIPAEADAPPVMQLVCAGYTVCVCVCAGHAVCVCLSVCVSGCVCGCEK